jgi:hypothetical protein
VIAIDHEDSPTRVRFVRPVQLPGANAKTVEQIDQGEGGVVLRVVSDGRDGAIGVALFRDGSKVVVPLAIVRELRWDAAPVPKVEELPPPPGIIEAIEQIAAAVAAESGPIPALLTDDIGRHVIDGVAAALVERAGTSSMTRSDGPPTPDTTPVEGGPAVKPPVTTASAEPPSEAEPPASPPVLNAPPPPPEQPAKSGKKGKRWR